MGRKARKPANPGTSDYTMAELMVVEMSRHLADDDGHIGGMGMGATMPMAAARLAVETVAPNLSWFCGGPLNPTFDRLPMSSIDPMSLVGMEAFGSMMDIVVMGLTGKWRFGFQGGMQIDKYGNCNMIGIGPYERLKVRGPGSVGVLWMASMEKAYLFVRHHDSRVFVEKVDFVSAPGFLDGGDSRWKHVRSKSKGPAFVYTPICVMDFEENTKAMRLHSVHPGYNINDIIENTGFELIVPEQVPTTKAPTEHELFVLRTRVDRTGVLKKYALTFG